MGRNMLRPYEELEKKDARRRGRAFCVAGIEERAFASPASGRLAPFGDQGKQDDDLASN